MRALHGVCVTAKSARLRVCGPLHNAADLLKRALDIHFAPMRFKGDWHFEHRSFGGQRSQLGRMKSEVLARRAAEPCKLPMMRGRCKCSTCA